MFDAPSGELWPKDQTLYVFYNQSTGKLSFASRMYIHIHIHAYLLKWYTTSSSPTGLVLNKNQSKVKSLHSFVYSLTVREQTSGLVLMLLSTTWHSCWHSVSFLSPRPDPFEAFIIFSIRHEIRRIDLHKRDYSLLVPGLRNTIALDFHFNQSLLYWTDVVEDKIYRGKLSESGGMHTHKYASPWTQTSSVWLKTERCLTPAAAARMELCRHSWR